ARASTALRGGSVFLSKSNALGHLTRRPCPAYLGCCMTPPVRWGILSAAGIARKNWRAIQLSGNGIVAAVASRDSAKAQKFIAENQAAAPFAMTPRALGSYEELLAAKDIDAVYIPLPTGLRKEWV